MAHLDGFSRANTAAAEETRRKRAARKQERLEDEDAGDDLFSLRYDFPEPVGTLRIQEDWSGEGNGIAGLQWLGGVMLSRYLDSRKVYPENFFFGKRVVEVGAGCGLTGIYLAARGAQVALTDMDTDKCLENISANLGHRGLEHHVAVHTLVWGAAIPEALLLRSSIGCTNGGDGCGCNSSGGGGGDTGGGGNSAAAAAAGPPDFVLAGDCLYEIECIEPLLRTLWALAGPETEVLVCGAVGEDVLAAFLAAVGRYFELEQIDTQAVDTLAKLPEAAMVEPEQGGGGENGDCKRDCGGSDGDSDNGGRASRRVGQRGLFRLRKTVCAASAEVIKRPVS